MNVAVIFAGGIGSRMHSKALPKQFLLMHGKPIIAHTIDVFESSADIDAIVVACVPEWINHLKEIIKKYNIKKIKAIVPGGRTGQESIYNGLLAVKEFSSSKDTIVLIHDGVRPLITSKTIHDNIISVRNHGSAITCVKVKETVLVVDENNRILTVPKRDDSRLARAPQSFWINDILNAHQMALQENKTTFIDSCSLMQYYGKQLYLVEGPEANIKVTTPEDFYIMRAMLDAKENAQIYGVED